MTPGLRLLIRLRPVLRFVKHKILHTDDSPQRIAGGIAIGLFCAWLPLLGLHMLLAAIIATLLRANKAMALLWVWVSNPLTAVIIYYPAYRLGRLVLGFFQPEQVVDPEHIEEIFTETLTLSHLIVNFFEPTLWKQVWNICLTVGQEMLIGGIILGAIAAKTGYWLSLKAITLYRDKRPHHFRHHPH